LLGTNGLERHRATPKPFCREQQASALAYFDAFLVFTVVAAVLALLVPLMKRSAAQRSAHIAAE
jgi:MFS transporter, DHA2 family, multidrug resistance protein